MYRLLSHHDVNVAVRANPYLAYRHFDESASRFSISELHHLDGDDGHNDDVLMSAPDAAVLQRVVIASGPFIMPQLSSGAPAMPLRVFCGVFTTAMHRRQLRSVLRTWGRRCDGFIAFSDEDDPALSGESHRDDEPDDVDVYFHDYEHGDDQHHT